MRNTVSGRAPARGLRLKRSRPESPPARTS